MNILFKKHNVNDKIDLRKKQKKKDKETIKLKM